MSADIKQPTDHLSKQRRDVDDEPVTFVFDGEEFTVKPSDSTSLEFLDALDEAKDDPSSITRALRALLGVEQAKRLFRGRNVEDLDGFFDVVGEAVGAGNL